MEPLNTTKKIQDFKTPSSGGLQTVKAPKARLQIKSAKDKPEIILCSYGAPGSGKSTITGQLACSGLKTFTFFTDLGGDAGEKGPRVWAAKMGKLKEYEENTHFTYFNLDSLELIKDFIADPESVVPDFWSKYNPDVITWDGFGFFQSLYVIPDQEEQVADVIPDVNTPDAGFSNPAMMRGWGLVRNATVRPLSRFLTLKNPNKPCLHKTITTGVKYKSVQIGEGKNSRSEMQETDWPDIAGSSAQTMRYGFDACIKCVSDDRGNFGYQAVAGDKKFSKNRFELSQSYPGDFMVLWNSMLQKMKEKLTS